MDADKDVLDKADALLRRHAGTPGTDTGAFPVLTDLLPEGDVAAAQAAPTPTGLPVSEPPADSDFTQEVIARVMADIEGRLAVELEARLVQHLVPQVHAAVASALGDLHQELANLVGDAITEALSRRNPK